MSKLIIVESPTKVKTIKKYLGKDYDVTASMGHVRDLPAARLSVDIKNDFAPKYAVIKGKEKLVKELKEKVAESHGQFRGVCRLQEARGLDQESRKCKRSRKKR